LVIIYDLHSFPTRRSSDLSSYGSIKRRSHLRSYIVRKQFSEPIRFDCRSERQDGIHFSGPPADLMNFSRHEKRVTTHDAFARQRASPAMHEVASQCSFDHPCDAIAETDHDALSQSFIIDDSARL